MRKVLSMYSFVGVFKKKYIALILVFLFILSACNGKKVDQNMESDPNTANPSVETTIYNIFQGDEEDKVKAEKILDQIDQIDWTVFWTISDDFSPDDPPPTFQLLDFLKEFMFDSDIDMDKKVNFFKATKHLDGAYAEQYCSVVGDLFLQDKKGTISLISQIDPSKYEEMIGFILYRLAYTFSDEELDKIQDQVEELKKSDITDSEKRVIDIFLNKMAEARGEDGYF
jgi:hypothetical protein